MPLVPELPLLYHLLVRTRARGTHHRIALDALRHLRGPAADGWRRALLYYHEALLLGSKAPDDQFKDFQNHVLHVGDRYWGGAPTAARSWYAQLVDALSARQWREAAFAAGVVSHYWSDPLMPLHTAQSEAEQVVHRALEWSVAKSYGELQHILEVDLGGYPDLETGDDEDWLPALVRRGAELAHPHYATLIAHYDLARGVKHPPAGLDQELKDRLALLLGYAVVGFARILERAAAEAAVEPPRVILGLETVFATLTVPVAVVLRDMADSDAKEKIEAQFQEFRTTGKVLHTATEDDQTIRALHAAEVLRQPLDTLDAEPCGPIGEEHGTGAEARPHPNRPRAGAGRTSVEALARLEALSAGGTRSSLGPRKKAVVESGIPNKMPASTRPAAPAPARPAPLAAPKGEQRRHDLGHAPNRAHDAAAAGQRFYLERQSPVVDAPSIGPKTAERLTALGVRTVDDLLARNPEELARGLKGRHIDAGTVRAWQSQARLVCRIPGLRGHDAQLLVACGVRSPEQLVDVRPGDLLEQLETFCASPEAERILRGGSQPDLDEVMGWIAAARNARPLKV